MPDESLRPCCGAWCPLLYPSTVLSCFGAVAFASSFVPPRTSVLIWYARGARYVAGVGTLNQLLHQRASERGVRRLQVRTSLCQLASGMEESESMPELEEHDISDPTPQNPTPTWSASAQSQAPHATDTVVSTRQAVYRGTPREVRFENDFWR